MHVLKSGLEWTLAAHLGQQKKQEKVERDCCEVIYGLSNLGRPSKVMG